MNNPGRSFESYAYRVFFLLLAAVMAYRAIDGGPWHLWIFVANFLAGVISGGDFEKEWRWWVATLGCTLLAGLVLYWISRLEPTERSGARLQFSVIAGGLFAAIGIFISGRVRRVWAFTRPADPPASL